MGAIRTSLRLLKSARHGVTIRDKKAAFQCAALGCMGERRRRLRAAFMASLRRQARDGQVQISLRLDGKQVTLHLRQDNHADYVVAGEIITGAYCIPDSIAHQPSIIIDGGANIGCFALRAHAHFPQSAIICYEPDADNLQQLRKNLEFNSVHATVIPKALWSRETRMYFHPSQSDAGRVDETPSAFPVDCVEVSAPNGCWLKLDIEGAEYEVLPQLLESGQRPAIISMEIHHFAGRGMPLIELLQSAGYVVSGSYEPHDSCVNITAILKSS
jgi:FkbM family methyltransferase